MILDQVESDKGKLAESLGRVIGIISVKSYRGLHRQERWKHDPKIIKELLFKPDIKAIYTWNGSKSVSYSPFGQLISMRPATIIKIGDEYFTARERNERRTD